QQHTGVDLGVAADEVLGVRAERDAVLVIPALGGHVPLAAEDLFGLPVLEFPREVAAALEHEDLLAGRRETLRQRPAARAAADDAHVVGLHRSAYTSAIGEVPAPLAPRSLGWVRISANSRTPSRASAAVSRFSTMNTPCRALRNWGTANGWSGASAGSG